MATVVKGRILNCDPSVGTDADWGIEQAKDAGVVPAKPRLPRSRDLRADWWKVGNQGTTGSCVGWAVADGALRWHLVKARRLEPAQRLSVRFAWMAAKETDEWSSSPTTFIEQEGTSIKAALDVARKFGAVPDNLVPFRSTRLYQGDPKSFFARAAKLKLRSYFGLHSPGDKWRHWLAHTGPIIARFEIDKAFNDATAASAVIDAYTEETGYGGHALSIVGYTKNHFIVRNSWGSTWGDHGFARVSDAYARAATTEAYGLTT